MKKFILLLTAIIFLISANLFAQEQTKKTLLSNEEFFEKADYILEGTVIPYDPIKGPDFYDALGNYDIEDLYTSYLIRVTYTYKVDSTFTIKRGDTINVIKKGGRIIKNADDPYNMEIINYFSQDRYESGVIQEPVWVGGEVIYFMKKNDLPLNPDSSKHNKYLKLTMLQDVKKGAIRIINHGFRITGLNDLSFGSRYELYKYMKQMDSTLNIPLKNVNKMREDLSYDKGAWEIYLKEQNIKIKETNNKEHIDSLNNFLERKAKQAKENSEKKKKDKAYFNSTKTPNILNITIQDQKVEYNSDSNKYYFKFKVYASANNNSTYLDNVILRLNYNTVAFGTNIKQNNKIKVFNGPEMDSLTYFPSDYVYDISSNCINLGTGISYHELLNPSRTQLTTNEIEIFNVKIELLNNLAGINSNIIFTDIETTSIFSMFTSASNIPYNQVGAFIIYDSTNYISPTNFSIITCQPILYSFSPTTRNAGVEDILTITGNYFGTQKGEVLFAKAGIAFDTTIFLVGLDSSYIVSWANNQIRVKIPSFVRKGYLDHSGNPETGFGSSAGSGKIKIRTARKDYVISADTLKINYSVTNTSVGYDDPYPICRVYLARLSSCNDIVFTLHNNISPENNSNSAAIINAIETALRRWSTLLDINLVLEKNSSNQYVYANDFTASNKNIIGFSSTDANGNPFSGMSTIISKISVGIVSPYPQCNTYYRKYGSHIYVQNNPTSPWTYQTTGTTSNNTGSFYEGILHELGHVLNINHVNNPNDLMYYALNPQSHAVSNITSNSMPVIGALTTVDASRDIIWEVGNINTLGHSLTPTISTSNPYSVICNNSPIILTANSAEATNYQWSTGATTQSITVNNEGNYVVTATNSNCSSNAVSEPFTVISDSLSASFAITPTSYNICTGLMIGGSITTNVIGNAAPYSFCWHSSAFPQTVPPSCNYTSQNLNNLESATYNVTITNSLDCSYLSSAVVPSGLQPRVRALSSTLSINNCNANVNVSGGVKPYTYDLKWKCENETSTLAIDSITTNLQSYTFDIICRMCKNGTGFYILTITDDCGNIKTHNINCCSSRENVNENNIGNEEFVREVKVYPNPSNYCFKISGIEKAEIEIYDLSGKLLLSQNNITEETEINIENLSNGLYFVKILEKNLTNSKIIIKE